MTDLSIIIPAYNEEGNLDALVGEIARAFAGLARPPHYEVILIDDGSSDRTLMEARQASSRVPQVRVFRHGRRAGKSAALKTGFDACRGRWVATLDGDGQNNPADLARLWPQIDAGPGTVIYAGVRTSRNDGLVKKITSRVANPLRRALLGDSARDTGCGFKVLPGELARTMPYFDNMHRFIPAMAQRQGFGVENVLVDDRPRNHGVSKYGFFDRAAVAFLDILGVYWLTRRYSPRGEITEFASAMRAEPAAGKSAELQSAPLTS